MLYFTSTEPLTIEGRAIAWVMRVVALSIFGYLTASIASYLVGGRVPGAGQPTTAEDRARLAAELADLRRRLQEIQDRLDRLLPPG